VDDPDDWNPPDDDPENVEDGFNTDDVGDP